MVTCPHVKCLDCDLYSQAALHWKITRKEAKDRILNFIFSDLLQDLNS